MIGFLDWLTAATQPEQVMFLAFLAVLWALTHALLRLEQCVRHIWRIVQ